MRRVVALGLMAALVFAGLAIAEGVTVTAHRGASGYLPELTLESYAMAHAQGVDYIEIDLVMTQDGVLITLHDLTLQGTTNVADVFPDRHREDGSWYAADFTLDEIKQLRVHERVRDDGTMTWPTRFPAELGDFRIPTFTEFVELVYGMNTSTGRDVGLYVELKHPDLHREHGLLMEEAVLEVLAEYPDVKAILQSFWIQAIEIFRELEADYPLAFLIWSPEQATEEALDEWAQLADGVNPMKGLVEANPEFVGWAHERGLFVHVWTFREDVLPDKYPTLEQELATFILQYLVDGVIIDQPDVAVRLLSGLGLR